MKKADTRGDSRRGGTDAVRVAFIVMSATTWPSLQSVWAACNRDPRFDVRVILAPNTYLDRQSKEFNQARAFLIRDDIPFTYGYEGILDDFRPEVVFVPSAYIDMLPYYLGAGALEAVGARIAYVPYGLEIGGGGFNMQYQFNLDLHNRAWRIFARSVSHRRMFARYCESGSGHVRVVGSPRLDQISRLNACDASELEAWIGRRKAILWTPHFSEGPSAAWSTFGRYRDHILEIFAKRAKTHVLIFRPHPLLFSHLRTTGYWTTEEEAAFRQRIAAAENVVLDESGSYLPAFKAAHALMADAGSFLLEFFATGKPLLYLSPEGGIGLNDDANLADYLYVCRGSADIARFVEAVGKGRDPMATQRRAGLSQFFHIPEKGTVGEAIADHVAQAILSGDSFRPRIVAKDELYAKARAYWAESTTTYLAPPEYYDRQEAVFREILGRHGPWASAADIGCGDGRFTRVLAGKADQVTACDISENLIAQAQAKAAEAGVDNIDWRVESLDAVRTLSRYDLCCCCGVLSGFLDVRAYAVAISMLRAMTKPQGLLITKESLSLSYQKVVQDADSGYVAIYRNAQEYLDSFLQQGFELVGKVVLRRDEQTGLENAFFVFRRG